MNEFYLAFCDQEAVKKQIKECEGKHIQQVAYSSYHDALTQICFGCRMIRTSLKKEEIKNDWRKPSGWKIEKRDERSRNNQSSKRG